MKIGIIGAMDEEVRLLRDKLENKQEQSIAGCEFYTGNIENTEIVLLKSGIGKVNAALAAALLNQVYNPNVIINTGSAGGFHQNLEVGDVVISNYVSHHDVDVTPFGYEYGQVPGMPTKYEADSELITVAEKAAESIKDIQIVTGLIATGDSFMSDPDRVEFVRSQFADLYAVEMEAAAIAQVCHQFQTPFIIIRSLSDIAGKESPVSFEKFLETASVNSTKLILQMLKELN